MQKKRNISTPRYYDPIVFDVIVLYIRKVVKFLESFLLFAECYYLVPSHDLNRPGNFQSSTKGDCVIQR